MSDRPSRPRRSAPTSYKHLLAPFALTSSSSSENDSDSDSTKRAKLLKKKKTNFIPSEESGSEFEAPPKGQEADEEEEESEDAEEAVVTEDEGPSGQGEEDMSDIASSGGEIDQGSPGPSGRKRGKSTKVNKGEGNEAKPGPRRSMVVTKGALPAGENEGREDSQRATANRVIPSGLDPQYSSFVPHYLPPSLILSTSTSTYSTAAVGPSKKSTKGKSDKDSSTLIERWTANPFAPEKTLVRDVGWEKGKWKDEEDASGVYERWGGWYEEIRMNEEDFAEVDSSAVDSRLPSQTYHSRPIPFHTLTSTQPTPSQSQPNPNTSASEEPESSMPVETQPTQTQSTKDPFEGRRKVFVGGINGEGEQEISLERFESMPLNSFIPRKPGHLLNVGGPVSALFWLPRLTGPSTKEFLAISTCSSPSLTLSHPPNLTGSKTSSLIQIWSLSTPKPENQLALETVSSEEDNEEDEGGMKFEMGLALGEGEGEARDLVWCPRGGTLETGEKMEVDDSSENDQLGVLAGVFTDGKVKVFVVPKPETVREKQGKEDSEVVYLKAKKVLELSLPDTSCLSFAWGSWETIAAGCVNGYVAVWYVGDALRKGHSTVRPTQYLPIHSCAIRALTFVNSPPASTALDSAGEFDLSGDPNRIATVGYDGSTHVVDLRESGSAGVGVVLHERSSTYTAAFCPQSGCVYADDQDDRIRAYFLKSAEFGSSKRIGAHRGTVWSLATSAHHPFVLSSSSDGTVAMHSGVRALRRRRVKGHFSQKVYSLDFERETGKWRMKDNWQVEHRSALDSLPAGSSKSSKSTGEPPLTSILAWPQEIQINKVCWHPNLERSALVASGGNWGCVRIDWVEGVGEREG